MAAARAAAGTVALAACPAAFASGFAGFFGSTVAARRCISAAASPGTAMDAEASCSSKLSTRRASCAPEGWTRSEKERLVPARDQHRGEGLDVQVAHRLGLVFHPGEAKLRVSGGGLGESVPPIPANVAPLGA